MILTIFCPIILTILSIIVLTYFAKPLNLLDIPNHRKQHGEPIAMIGGIAIYISLLITSLIINLPYTLNVIIYVSSIVLLIGLLNDIFNLGVVIRLIFQITASLFVIFSGLSIVDIGEISNFGIVSFGIFSGIFTIFSVISLTNAFNFIDGLDGLAGGLFLVALFSLLIFIYFGAGTDDLEIIIVLISSVSIYWIINVLKTPIKKIFLGDSGSLLLGFLIAWLLIYYAHPNIRAFHPVLVLWCVAIPVYDIVSVVIRRIIFKKYVFLPDLSHIHHLVILQGYSKNVALYSILLLAILLSLFGLISYKLFGPAFSLIFFFILLIIYLLISYNFSKKNIN
tara:strand:- start:2 stop:1015 length:1014 start_codon:yes stop_codon:yes gene_type:complete